MSRGKKNTGRETEAKGNSFQFLEPVQTGLLLLQKKTISFSNIYGASLGNQMLGHWL